MACKHFCGVLCLIVVRSNIFTVSFSVTVKKCQFNFHFSSDSWLLLSMRLRNCSYLYHVWDKESSFWTSHLWAKNRVMCITVLLCKSCQQAETIPIKKHYGSVNKIIVFLIKNLLEYVPRLYFKYCAFLVPFDA